MNVRWCKKGKDSPYSITERMVPELIPVLGSQPAGDVSHKPGGRLPLLSARPAVTPATLNMAATNFAAWWTEAWWLWTVCLKDCYPTASRLRFESRSFCAWVQHAYHSATEPSVRWCRISYISTLRKTVSHQRMNVSNSSAAAPLLYPRIFIHTYNVGQKSETTNSWPYFCQILTDFHSFSTARFLPEFAVKWLLSLSVTFF